MRLHISSLCCFQLHGLFNLENPGFYHNHDAFDWLTDSKALMTGFFFLCQTELSLFQVSHIHKV